MTAKSQQSTKTRSFQTSLPRGNCQEKTFTEFPKKYYKNSSVLDADWNKPFSHLIRLMKRFKRLHSISFYYPYFSNHHHAKYVPVMQKIVKSLKKSLRNAQGSLECPEVQKLLPLLDELVFTPKNSTWKVLTSRSAFKYLTFNFFSEYEMSFNKYKIILSRSLPKLKHLKSLEILLLAEDSALILFILELFNKKASFESLRAFQLMFASNSPSINFDDLLVKKPEINQAIEKITQLKLYSKEWFSFLITAGKFENLSNLELEIEISSKEGPWNFEYFSHFQDLRKLEKFSFVFRANSVNCEKELFRYLTLPPALKEFYFGACDFPWNEITLNSNPFYTQFLERIKDNKSLAELDLSLYTENDPYLIDRFAQLFIQNFKKLERVIYCNYDPEDFFLFRKGHSQIEPLILKDFWKALESSKTTLQYLEIDSYEITFPEEISILDVGFPKLRNLDFKSKVSCVAKLGAFWLGFPCVKHIQVSELRFSDEEKFGGFFDDIKEISADKFIVLEVNVENISQNLLIRSLKKFIHKANIKGRLSLHFKNVHVEDVAAFGELLRLAVDKRCFWKLQMDEKELGKIFWIRTDKIISLRDALVYKPKLS